MALVYTMDLLHSEIVYNKFTSPQVIELILWIQKSNSLGMQYINKHNLNVKQMDIETNNNSDKIR